MHRSLLSVKFSNLNGKNLLKSVLFFFEQSWIVNLGLSVCVCVYLPCYIPVLERILAMKSP